MSNTDALPTCNCEGRLTGGYETTVHKQTRGHSFPAMLRLFQKVSAGHMTCVGFTNATWSSDDAACRRV